MFLSNNQIGTKWGETKGEHNWFTGPSLLASLDPKFVWQEKEGGREREREREREIKY